MIKFQNEWARHFAANKAQSLGDVRSFLLLQNGVKTPDDASHLAQLYWSIVDANLDQDVEYLLDQTYSALQVHCANNGFESAWAQEVPDL